jgi:hypothetical protein
MFPQDGLTRSELLAKANAARRSAQRAGRNQTIFYAPDQ